MIRDIGKANNPQKRLKQHWYTSRKKKNHLGCWLRSLAKPPALLILKEVPESEWQEWERRYIRCAKALGFRLVNGTEGGEGGSLPGAEHPMFGKVGPNKGKKHSLETREKISAAARGRKHSPETRAKISAAKVGKPRKPFSIETRAKMRAAGLVKRFSAEHRANLSAAGIGRKHSVETREKISAANQGRKLSSEQHAKLVVAQQKRRIAEKKT